MPALPLLGHNPHFGSWFPSSVCSPLPVRHRVSVNHQEGRDGDLLGTCCEHHCPSAPSFWFSIFELLSKPRTPAQTSREALQKRIWDPWKPRRSSWNLTLACPNFSHLESESVGGRFFFSMLTQTFKKKKKKPIHLLFLENGIQ